MKGKFKCFALALFLTGACSGFSQGYIIPNGVTSYGFQAGIGYSIIVVHDPSDPTGSYTGFSLNPISANTFQFDPIVDVGVRVFEVSPNDPITATTILAADYPELTFSETSDYTFAPNVPFYLALYTGNENFHPPNDIYTDPIFGWAELENVNGSIQLLNSALEYQGTGIYAGTQTIIQPVPEPDELALVALCALLLASIKRRSSLAAK
jgi:hypothetical protein